MLLSRDGALRLDESSGSARENPFVKVFRRAAHRYACQAGDGAGSFVASLSAAIEHVQLSVTEGQSRVHRVELIHALRFVISELLPRRVFPSVEGDAGFLLSPVDTAGHEGNLARRCLLRTVLCSGSVCRDQREHIIGLVLKLWEMRRRPSTADDARRGDRRLIVCVADGASSLRSVALIGVLIARPIRHAQRGALAGNVRRTGNGDVSIALMTGRLFDEFDRDLYDEARNGDKSEDSDDDGEYMIVARHPSYFREPTLASKVFRVDGEVRSSARRRPRNDDDGGEEDSRSFGEEDDATTSELLPMNRGNDRLHAVIRFLRSLEVDMLVTTQQLHETLVSVINGFGVSVVSSVHADDFDRLVEEMHGGKEALPEKRKGVSTRDGDGDVFQVMNDSMMMKIGEDGTYDASTVGSTTAFVRRECSVMEYGLRNSMDKFVCISCPPGASDGRTAANEDPRGPSSLSALVCAQTKTMARVQASHLLRCWTVLERAEAGCARESPGVEDRSGGGDNQSIRIEPGGFFMELRLASVLRSLKEDIRIAGKFTPEVLGLNAPVPRGSIAASASSTGQVRLPALLAAIDVVLASTMAPVRLFLSSAVSLGAGSRVSSTATVGRQVSSILARTSTGGPWGDGFVGATRAENEDENVAVGNLRASVVVRRCTPLAMAASSTATFIATETSVRPNSQTPPEFEEVRRTLRLFKRDAQLDVVPSAQRMTRSTVLLEHSVAVHNFIDDGALGGDDDDFDDRAGSEHRKSSPPPRSKEGLADLDLSTDEPSTELLHVSWGVLHPKGSLSQRTFAVLEACLLGVSVDERTILSTKRMKDPS